MERKLNIAVLVSRPSAVETVDVAWDEPVVPPVGQRTGHAPGLPAPRPPADGELTRGDSTAE